MNSIRIDELTWVDIKEKIENGYKTVVFGVGSTEQHGPSLPEKTDALQADQFANLQICKYSMFLCYNIQLQTNHT